MHFKSHNSGLPPANPSHDLPGYLANLSGFLVMWGILPTKRRFRGENNVKGEKIEKNNNKKKKGERERKRRKVEEKQKEGKGGKKSRCVMEEVS